MKANKKSKLSPKIRRRGAQGKPARPKPSMNALLASIEVAAAKRGLAGKRLATAESAGTRYSGELTTEEGPDKAEQIGIQTAFEWENDVTTTPSFQGRDLVTIQWEPGHTRDARFVRYTRTGRAVVNVWNVRSKSYGKDRTIDAAQALCLRPAPVELHAPVVQERTAKPPRKKTEGKIAQAKAKDGKVLKLSPPGVNPYLASGDPWYGVSTDDWEANFDRLDRQHQDWLLAACQKSDKLPAWTKQWRDDDDAKGVGPDAELTHEDYVAMRMGYSGDPETCASEGCDGAGLYLRHHDLTATCARCVAAGVGR